MKARRDLFALPIQESVMNNNAIIHLKKTGKRLFRNKQVVTIVA